MARKLDAQRKATLSVILREIESQSEGICDHIEFLRDNAGVPPFADKLATTRELLALRRASKDEFIELTDYHVPIYLGQCLIDELGAHWSVEHDAGNSMFAKPYVDGFGNIAHENVYLPQLRLHGDARRFDGIRRSCTRAFRLLAAFTETFSHLSGSEISRSELEQQCVDLGVLPTGREARHVWRTRVTRYGKLLKITIKRG